jgi:hypothetical protein
MNFLVDSKDQSIFAYKSRGLACRALLKKCGVDVLPGDDPVKMAKEKTSDRFIILNLSGAFEAISESDDRAAQELATSFKKAIDAVFK